MPDSHSYQDFLNKWFSIGWIPLECCLEMLNDFSPVKWWLAVLGREFILEDSLPSSSILVNKRDGDLKNLYEVGVLYILNSFNLIIVSWSLPTYNVSIVPLISQITTQDSKVMVNPRSHSASRMDQAQIYRLGTEIYASLPCPTAQYQIQWRQWGTEMNK